MEKANANATFPTPASFEASKLIKKYPNRKLYDTTSSEYVTLTDIYTYIENGESVQVINNKTKENVTTAVLLNALVEKGKGETNGAVAGMLEYVADYIKGGSNV